LARPAYELPPEKKIRPVLRKLAARYGSRRPPAREPLAVLIRGVLSQNTSDVNSGRAYESLIDSFGDWQGVAAASPEHVARAIRSGGLAEQKARTICAVMRWLRGEDGYSLDFLHLLADDEVEKRLLAIKGVGIKTARLVLLFGFGRPVFVVDTHVHRVSLRLGLIPAGCSRQKAHLLLNGLVPDDRKCVGHLDMIQHGRQTCKARSPLCPACPVAVWCLFVRGAG
jgi:endonuclease-3